MRFAWELLGRFQWAILLSIPPLIVLLYFLKLRREPLEVPSTYLWARTVEDLHVNSIWQKLRRNLLLFLQLLLLLFAILACLNPSWSGTKLEEDRSKWAIRLVLLLILEEEKWRPHNQPQIFLPRAAHSPTGNRQHSRSSRLPVRL